MKRVEPRIASNGKGPMHIAPLESVILSSLPNLVQHLCVTRYDDGTARTAGWMSINTQGALWTVTVKDPDSKCQMRLSAGTLDDALALADVMLGAEEAPWEPDRFAIERETGRKKK